MDIEKIYNDIAELVEDRARIVRNADMSEYTTFRIGGPADLLVRPASEAELAGILSALRAQEVPVTVLGNGSNVLVRDGGIRGAVIRIGRDMSAVEVKGDLLTAQAGALLSSAASAAAAAELTGMEFAAGIPGSVGGAVFMNAGAYGGEMSQIVVSCRALMPDGSLREFSGPELKLGYRRSAFSENGGIILSCTMKLRRGAGEEIAARMKELAARRAEKQPLSLPSAGSTFKRPEGYFAGKLIEDAGCRGLSVGGARVSQKHAGFVVNEGGATAEDVLTLMDLVRMTVKDMSGVELEPEVRIIGEEKRKL